MLKEVALAGSNIVSFEEALRAREEERPHILSLSELEARQGSVPLKACHAALDNVTLIYRTKALRTPVFSKLTAAFPKGRKIAVLGHKGSGTDLLVHLLLRRRAPNNGSVYINSRLSWPGNRNEIVERKLSFRANALFASDVFGLSPRQFIAAVQRFCQLTPRQMRDKTSNMPQQYRRRLSFAMFLAGNFDCHIFDGPFKGGHLGFSGRDAAEVEALALSRDLIMTATSAKSILGICDLAYILYDGRLYMFEDVREAARVFDALPVPASPLVPPQPQEADDEDEEPREEVA